MDITNKPIRYFVAYWEDLWSGVSRARDLLTVFNPRVVVKELLDEITLNKERNRANEEFFRRALGAYLKNDPGSQGRLKLNLQMLVKEFDTLSQRPAYAEQLCRSTLKEFEALLYFEDSLVALVLELQKQSLDECQKVRIQTVVNHLIVELRELGFEDDEIRKIPSNLFAAVHRRDNVVFWNYPHSFECRDWKDEGAVNEYEHQLRQHEASLSELDRVRALLRFANSKRERFTYIFRVNGMVGTEELHVGEVTLYPPAKKRLITRDDSARGGRDYELFRSSEFEPAINAAVAVEAVSVAAGEALARTKAERALSACRRIMRGESPLRLSGSFVALRDEGRLAAASHQTFEHVGDDWTKRFSLDAEQSRSATRQLSLFEKTRGISEAHGWERKFDQACYWLRRADESTSHVERLLAYWICIESICSKSDESRLNWFQTKKDEQETDIFLVKEIVGKMRAVAKCFEHGWTVYNEIAEPDAIALLSIPADLVKAAQLAPAEDERVHLANFVRNADKIEALLPEGLFKDQLGNLKTFYSDKEVALRLLRKHLRTAQDEIAYIYRMRNKIAHDGRGDDPMLPFLSKLAASYALTLFHRIVFYATEKGGKALPSMLITAVQEYERIEARLQVEGPMSVFLHGEL